MSTPSIQPSRDPAVQYLLRLGDTCLILGQRLSEWCGHAPILEEDIALTNMALDLIGQSRALLPGNHQTTMSAATLAQPPSSKVSSDPPYSPRAAAPARPDRSKTHKSAPRHLASMRATSTTTNPHW